MRYTKKEESPYQNLSVTLRKDIVEHITVWQNSHKIRNRSVAIEKLVIQGLQAEGVKIWK